MSKETLIEKLRGYKSTPRHCEELCYDAAVEIESLRQQLAEANATIDAVKLATPELDAIGVISPSPRLLMENYRKVLEERHAKELESITKERDDHIKREVMLRKLVGEIYCSDESSMDVMRKIEDVLAAIDNMEKPRNDNAEI